MPANTMSESRMLTRFDALIENQTVVVFSTVIMEEVVSMAHRLLSSNNPTMKCS